MAPSSFFRPPRSWILVGLLALGLFSAMAEAPLVVAKSREARSRLVSDAESYLGTPYRYGGSDRSGFDCSGLVYRVYADALDLRVPRTARALYDFAQALRRSELQPGDLVFFNTTGPIAHVGIYAGEGRFLHAASEGPKTGVIYSSLNEAYWARAYAGAGRLIPPAEYLGLILSAALGPTLGVDPVLRGMQGEAGVSYPILGLELGLALRPEYDHTLGVVRLPLVISVGIDRELRFFAGPALTVGDPSLGEGEAARDYEASGGFLATAGLSWSPWSFRLGGISWGLAGELAYNRYVPASGEVANTLADTRARLRAGILIRARWGL